MELKYKINKALEGVYNKIKESAEFVSLSQDEMKLRVIFLGHADKAISFGEHGVSAAKAVYTYYKPNKTFLEINLNNSPDFINKTEFIEWFEAKYLEGFQNLNSI